MESKENKALKRLKDRRVEGLKFSKSEEEEYQKLLYREAKEKLIKSEIDLKEAYILWERAQIYAIEPIRTVAQHYATWFAAREKWVLALKRMTERQGYLRAPVVSPVQTAVSYENLTAQWNYDCGEQTKNTDN